MSHASTRVAILLAALIAFSGSARFSLAQTGAGQTEPLPVVTRAYAIENARIVPAPGEVIERGTIVIRNGRIEAVGRNIGIPSDAQRIAGDTLVVYAGFIDGLSSAGIPSSESSAGNTARPNRPGDPSYDEAGIQPQRRAAELFSRSEASITALRNAGFTAAHVVPNGRMMPGKGALILLGGDSEGRMILDDDASVLLQFEGTRGVYPSTDMAIMARIRQLFRDARHHGEATRLYRENPSTADRPVTDEVLRALGPVVDGSTPAVFYTDGNSNALQIRRALVLQRDLGFNLVLAGANQTFEVIEPIRSADIPLLLTLDLPKDDAADADSTAEESPSGPSTTQYMRDFRTRNHADTEGEKSNLEARQKSERERYYRSAADLHRAGILFGFTTRNVKPEDIHKNLRLMVEYGLPSNAALAALTINAARIFDIAEVAGTIEAGKMANLVLTNGDLFDEDTKIRQVFVDGVPYDVEESTRSRRSGNARRGVRTTSR